jgi:SAM-dependent methyltransferase
MLSAPLRQRIQRKIGKALFDNSIVGHTEWALKSRLRWNGGSRTPAVPSLGLRNGVLQTDQEVDEAIQLARQCGLPPHQDRPKNWDALIALSAILETTPRTGRILDAGATLYSVLLPWLYLYGYRDLTGIDLIYPTSLRRGPICYEQGDLTKTRFEDASFDAIGCLSVIEHGVDFEAYVREMARILRPGGMLITSTDYWATGVDTGGIEAYGVPIKILTRSDLLRLIHIGHEYGLHAEADLDWGCRDRVVGWQGLGFTFACVCMCKARQ